MLCNIPRIYRICTEKFNKLRLRNQQFVQKRFYIYYRFILYQMKTNKLSLLETIYPCSSSQHERYRRRPCANKWTIDNLNKTCKFNARSKVETYLLNEVKLLKLKLLFHSEYFQYFIIDIIEQRNEPDLSCNMYMTFLIQNNLLIT